jgi:hypothetical protein
MALTGATNNPKRVRTNLSQVGAGAERRIGRNPDSHALPLGNANMCGLRIAGFGLRRRAG